MWTTAIPVSTPEVHPSAYLKQEEAGKMGQWLKGCVVKTEGLSSIPWAHAVE